jgi:hypothetical protein
MTPVIDARTRAALLWDRPSLFGLTDDAGARQWRAALELRFVNFEELDEKDILSLAAHVVRAAVEGMDERSTELRAVLRLAGSVGRLFDGLLGLALALDDLTADKRALSDLLRIVEALLDTDLQARLLIRLATYGRRRDADLATRAAERAVRLTDPSTRLGVVARRGAFEFGIELGDFDPWAPTNTPEDPLLTLSWVQTQLADAAAKLATRRFEHQIAGVWDTSFQIGRTSRGDLYAASLQAQWCGAASLRSQAQKLLATDILGDATASTSDVRWGLELWASEPTSRRVVAAVSAAEPHLDASAAADLLTSVRDDPETSDDRTIEVAAAVWDLLSDEDADRVIAWLAAAEPQHVERTWENVIGALLWRRPRAWTDLFAVASTAQRAAMFAAVRPGHLHEAPDDLMPALAAHAASTDLPTATRAALQVIERGQPICESESLTVLELLDLLEWNVDAVAPETIGERVDELTAGIHKSLTDIKETGTIGVPAFDVRHALGELASYLPERHAPAVTALTSTVSDPAAPANWQFGALEGLAALARAGRLDPDDRTAIGAMMVVPGTRILGEQISEEVLHAAQLRVVGAATEQDIRWLAVVGRGSDAQARLMVMAALGTLDLAANAAADWSLVGGLFDPDDAVTIQAVAAIGRRGVSPKSGAAAVARDRLADLFARARRDLRRQVVITATARPELGGAEIVNRARADRSWIVRREARPV